MNVKPVVYKIKSLWLRIRSILCGAPSNPNNIPVVINNFNRLSTLVRLVDSLKSRGINNIIVLDNCSTYPPLLEWYGKGEVKVVRLEGNLGFKAIWKSKKTKALRHGWFVYTDSDLELTDNCPTDVMSRLVEVLTKERPNAIKVGLSLKIDDLPDCYARKEMVIAHETKFWEKRSNGLYRAPVDTTFALYRPGSGLNRSRYAEVYRLAPPYSVRHLPWYVDSANPTQEEIYYNEHCSRPTSWTGKTVAGK